MQPDRILIIDIDGLRSEVFAESLKGGRLPNLARLVGGSDLRRGWQAPALAPAPSITFASQASLFSGAHPGAHGITGNQFFDRFGRSSRGTPRHYAFDVGDTLSADDAVRVFTDGLASKALNAPTLYEQLNGRSWEMVVSAHMYARGATTWLRPSLINLARFTKGKNIFGIDAEDYDGQVLKTTLNHIKKNGPPHVLTIHFLGLDHESHHHGPQAQAPYLENVLDGIVGELWQAFEGELGAPLCVICSDHGQIEVHPDDRHSLRMAFPFERELGPLFDALGLDVHDFPGEDPHSDAVVSSNGGLAHVYLKNLRGRWQDPPDFEREVLPVAGAFWEAHATGRYTEDLKDALAGVLVRDTAAAGWNAPFQALTPHGERLPLKKWFDHQPPELYADPVNRLNNLAGPTSGDLLLISDYAHGFYFAAPVTGVHGGLHPEDSAATLAFGWPGASEEDWQQAQATLQRTIEARCRRENDRQPSTADMTPAILALVE